MIQGFRMRSHDDTPPLRTHGPRMVNYLATSSPEQQRGVHPVDDRRVLNGILWRFRTGSPWAEVPERYGPPQPAITALSAGGRPVSGIGFLKQFQKLMMGDIVMIDSILCSRSPARGHRKKRDRDDGGMGRSSPTLVPGSDPKLAAQCPATPLGRQLRTSCRIPPAGHQWGH